MEIKEQFKTIFLNLRISLLVFIMSVTLKGASYAQKSFVGTIKDSRGLPVINMNVRLVSSDETLLVLTDLDGKFEFKEILNPSFKLLITSMSFKSYEQEVDLNTTQQPFLITLVSKEINLQEV